MKVYQDTQIRTEKDDETTGSNDDEMSQDVDTVNDEEMVVSDDE